MNKLDVQRKEHAAARAKAVVEQYLRTHSNGMLDKKIKAGVMSVEDGYDLLREVSADPKTGVGRADLLPLVLSYEITGAEQHGWPLSVAVIDIDNFKMINTELTHLGGDQVLKDIADVLRQATRDSDEVVLGDQSIVRWGGEEFVVLLVGANSQSAVRVAERLRQIIAETFIGRRPNQQPITVSIGVAEWDRAGMKDWHDFLQLADSRLFQAKSGGKNKVVS